MKELTIEEKAKRYDEALTKARNIVNSINVGLIGKDSFEAVFPELKESEDEKIRKELLQIAEESEDSFYMVMTPNKREKLIAWLEKQGEQKIDDDDKAILENWEGIVKDNKEKWQLSDWFVEATLSLVQKIEQIGLPKSIVNNNKTMLNACVNTLRNVGHSHLAAWLEKQFEQKPAWSEKYIADVFEKVGLAKIVREQSNDNLTNALQDAMIELSKFAPQPKQEWSEEDEKIYSRIYDLIHAAAFENCEVDDIGNELGEYAKMTSWLKSLRPQNRWKPSDEQMERLKGTINSLPHQEVLYSLYQDLKKLREE